MNPLQKLYNNEINFTISTFWDGGFDWKLGDSLNGFLEQGCADTFEHAVSDLVEAALKHYPKAA